MKAWRGGVIRVEAARGTGGAGGGGGSSGVGTFGASCAGGRACCSGGRAECSYGAICDEISAMKIVWMELEVMRGGSELD